VRLIMRARRERINYLRGKEPTGLLCAGSHHVVAGIMTKIVIPDMNISAAIGKRALR
jgi:hypothetical protein